jgi:hypothetical protein
MAGQGTVSRLSVALLGLLGVGLRPAGILAQDKPPVIVTVYNRSKMRPPSLAAGQIVAEEILRRAGVKSIWINCPVPSTPEASAECRQPPGSPKLILTVVPHWAEQGIPSEALGLAVEVEQGFGSYCYVFRDRLEEIAATKHISHARLLGHAMAHEIGHLLKGSNSHSLQGLMSQHWYANEIQAVQMGALNFTAEEAAVIRTRLAGAAGGK